MKLPLPVLIVAMLFTVSACGQSGPLYLPGNPSEIQAPPPPEEQEQDEEARKRQSDDAR